MAHTVYIGFTVFSNFPNLQFIWHILTFSKFLSDDAHNANYGKHCLNHHFRHGAHSVYKMYSVFKLFEIAICFSHFDFFEISTAVMRIMVTMANIV